MTEAGSWRAARGPVGLNLGDLGEWADALARSLRDFFHTRADTGPFSTVSAHRVDFVCCFVGQVADRLPFVEAFSEDGMAALQRVRQAVPVLFAYDPTDGIVRCKSNLRAADRVAELLACWAACRSVASRCAVVPSSRAAAVW